MLNNQLQDYLQDYLHALKAPISHLNKLTQQQFTSLSYAFDINFSKKMSVIIEQQTEREGEDNQSQSVYLRREFNSQIKALFKIKEDLDEILSHYKNQLKKLAIDLKKSSEMNHSLEEKVKQLAEAVKSRENDEKQLRRSPKKLKIKDFQKQKYKVTQRQQKNFNSEDQLQIRKAPSPLKQNSCLNCLKFQEDKSRWRVLATKIQQVKKKNSSFQQQLRMKQQQIAGLRQNIAQLQKKSKDERQEDQKRKLKKDNTTLRGEKVLMANQLSVLKKQLGQKIELSEIQELEIKKLRIQIENITSSLNWHISNLHQLRNSQHRALSKQQKDQLQKVQLCHNMNKTLFELIVQQQRRMQEINSKTQRIEAGLAGQMDRYTVRVSELQSMLQDKNETIMRLKTNGVGLKSDKNGNYQSEMIRLLNRKLTEKQQRIRSLQQRLEAKEHISQQCQ